MSLVPDYGESTDSNSSDDSSDAEKSNTEDSPKERHTVQSKLPHPDFKVKITPDQKELQTNSVFKNPFLEAEHEKEAALQKHVKMVDLQNTDVINGRKICWNYRKGRCRFGHNCKFAHDSDIQKTPEQIEAEKILTETGGVVVHKKEVSGSALIEQHKNNDSPAMNGKRKRPGLTRGLIPGKKVMHNYMKHKK